MAWKAWRHGWFVLIPGMQGGCYEDASGDLDGELNARLSLPSTAVRRGPDQWSVRTDHPQAGVFYQQFYLSGDGCRRYNEFIGHACPYVKITLNPHVKLEQHTCVHMCPTCVVLISHVDPHVVKFFHMWNTCEVMQTQVYSVCPTCDSHEHTYGYMWASCGLLSLRITLRCGKNVWNWNNIRNPHLISCDVSVGVSYMQNYSLHVCLRHMPKNLIY